MLKPAQLYESELKRKTIESWYQPENIWFDEETGDSTIDLPTSNYNNHDFVSVDDNDNVIGYIHYRLDWAAMSACDLCIISFDKGNTLFAKDVFEAINNIFEVYGMNRLSWWSFADNPATKSYIRLAKLHGGILCGYQHEIAKLQDGKLHDAIYFEIMARDFKR